MTFGDLIADLMAKSNRVLRKGRDPSTTRPARGLTLTYLSFEIRGAGCKSERDIRSDGSLLLFAQCSNPKPYTRVDGPLFYVPSRASQPDRKKASFLPCEFKSI